MTTDKFILETHPENYSPFRVASYIPGQKIEQWDIEKGNDVILKVDKIDVIIKVIKASCNQFSGEIIGFENYINEYLHGKRAGDVIDFEYKHVFSYSR